MNCSTSDSLELEERESGTSSSSVGETSIDEPISNGQVFRELRGLIKGYGEYTGCDRSKLREEAAQSQGSCLISTSVISPQNRPKEKPVFFLHLNSCNETYSSSLSELENGSVFSLIYQSENLMLSYLNLTRYEYCLPGTVGTIQWRFDLSFIGNTWKRLAIRIGGIVSAGSSIKLNLIAHNRINSNQIETLELDLNTLNLVDAKQFKFCVGILDIIAVLEADDKPEEDDRFWTKPRLLCDGNNSKRVFLFEIY